MQLKTRYNTFVKIAKSKEWLITPNVDKDVEQLKLSYIVDGNVNGTITVEKRSGGILKKKKKSENITALLGIYPRERTAHVYKRLLEECSAQLYGYL